MAYGIKLHVWGELACFTRPEMKAERVSYDVLTPSAARGVLEAIYWKPQIRWVIDRIHVLKPIRFASIRRNEISNKIPAKGEPVSIDVTDQRQQRASLVLRDVAYAVEAHFIVPSHHFELGGPPQPGRELSGKEYSELACAGKHLDMFKRRARLGQYFHHPYLGCREFPADFCLIEHEMPNCELNEHEHNKDLGFMLHDISFDQDPDTKEVKDTTARFFRAEMKNGIIDVPPFEQTIT